MTATMEQTEARRSESLLELEPDLARLVLDDRRPAADAQLRVEVRRLAPGPWSPRLLDAAPDHLGLLLLDGVVSRDVIMEDTVSTELLGSGDVLRPWSLSAAEPLLQLGVRWTALTACTVAVLDRRFARCLAQWPDVNSALLDRIEGRGRRLAATKAISQLNRVDRRLLALFWHLAGRWGHASSEGMVLPLTLSHRMLSQLTGARRPTVSTALAELAERGQVRRRADATWLLTGPPLG